MKTLLTFACLMVLAFTSAEVDACPDFDGNGTVDIADFLLFINHFGTAEERYDLNADGQVNVADFLVFVEHFGKECPEEETDPGFNIDIVFVDESNFTETEKAIIQRAARRWEEVIVGDLSDADYSNEPVNYYDEDLEVRIVVNDVIDDLRIFIKYLDLGVEGPAGLGGPSWGIQRYNALKRRLELPDMGIILINNNDGFPNWLRDPGEHYEYYERLFFSFILHEIGHVLGIGSIWDHSHFGSHIESDDTDPHFTGHFAIKAFDEAGGTSYQGAKVPVNKDLAHWRDTIFGDEVMIQGWIEPNDTPISAITIQALADLGYKVDASKADPYRLPSRTTKPTTGLKRFIAEKLTRRHSPPIIRAKIQQTEFEQRDKGAVDGGGRADPAGVQ